MYTPNERTAQMLDRATQILASVPYHVSARWLFYRLLQEGFYASKSDYKNKFLPAISMARHENYGKWRPDTLADETRDSVVRGSGFSSVDRWLDAVAKQLSCSLDKWSTQKYYVELWFEARAMTQQFEYYTRYMTLRPMGGQPSIPYKYRAAQELSYITQPVVILYFGDLDPAGEMISEVVERDVRKWCRVDFKFIHCGLNAAQVRRYGVPENFDKPGQFQWEALTDDAAREIITLATRPYVKPAAFEKIEHEQAAATEWFRERFLVLADEWRSQ